MADLAAIMPGSSEPLRSAYLAPLNKAMAEFEINTPLRQAHFLAQMSYESGDLRGTEEKWGPTPQQERYEPSTSLGRSLGNTEPGDGERYRGRGLIWIIGRGNYAKYGAALGIDLVGQPDLASRPEVAVRTAGLFWKLARLNDLANDNDIAGITRKISGGSNGLKARTAATDRAKQVLGVANP
jgi:putative chitinase